MDIQNPVFGRKFVKRSVEKEAVKSETRSVF